MGLDAHILDYKPDAHTNKPTAQLAIYALTLTRLLPGLKLFKALFSQRSSKRRMS